MEEHQGVLAKHCIGKDILGVTLDRELQLSVVGEDLISKEWFRQGPVQRLVQDVRRRQESRTRVSTGDNLVPVHSVKLRFTRCESYVPWWSSDHSPDQIGLRALLGPSKHEALRASSRVALQQREGPVSAPVAAASFNVHLARALASLVALADTMVTGTGVRAGRVAVATLAVGEVVIAWPAVVAVLSFESLQALALACVLVTVRAQGTQLVAVAKLAAVDRVVTPGTGVAAVAPGTTRVLGADATARLLITDVSRCFARLASSAAVMGEPEVSWQADIAGDSSNTRLAWTLARPVVALHAYGAGRIAVTGFASTRRCQVPVSRLAPITGAANNVGFAGALPSVFITLRTQGSVRVTAAPFAAVQMQGEAIVSFKAGIAESAKHPRPTDAVASDRVAALGDRTLEVATAGGTATLRTSETILTPVTRAS